MNDFSARAINAKKSEDDFYFFAQDSRQFIKRCAFFACKRFVLESEDEWSIALIAFYEAVRTYDESKGSFKSFAAMVIRRRLMEYFDTQSRHNAEFAAMPETLDGQLKSEDPSAFELEVAECSAKANDHMQTGTTPLEDEVEAIRQTILPYGFDLYEIGGCSPKTAKTKQACAKVIEAICSSQELAETMRRKRNLPYVKLLEIPGVTNKLLERHRKYLIVAAEIRMGEYPQLNEYIVRITD